MGLVLFANPINLILIKNPDAQQPPLLEEPPH